MPLDGLDDKQIKFINKYLDTSIFRSKKKDEEVNAAYLKAAEKVFGEINRLRRVIGEVATKYEHAPVDLYANLLDMLEQQARDAIKAAKNEIKRGLAPDFGPVQVGLTELQSMIDKRIEQSQQGKGIDGHVADKERYGQTVMGELRSDLAEAEEIFVDSTLALELATETVLGQRAVAVRTWRELYAAAMTDLREAIDESTPKSTVTLDVFKTILDKRLEAFRDDAAVQLNLIVRLMTARPIDFPAEREKLEKGEAYTDQPAVKSVVLRLEAADAEAKKLEKAITEQKKKLEELRTAFANARNEDRAKARTDFATCKAQVQALQSRKQQLEAYVEGAEGKADILIAATQRTVANEDFAKRMAKALDEGAPEGIDELADVVEASKSSLLGLAVPGDSDAADALIAEMRDQVAASRARVVVLPRLDPKEPKVTELSDREAKALEAMLALAQRCADEGSFEVAAALVERVARDRRQYITARMALKLPEPQPPVPEGAAAIALRVTQFQGRLRDLIALGAVSRGGKDAATLLQEVTDLGARVKTADKKGEDIDETAENRLLDAIGVEVDKLAPPPPSKELVEARAKAGKTGQDVQAFLSDVMRTEKITDRDIIEEPGKTYSKEEQARLVRVDELIEVEVDGKIEQHKILQRRKGKGGQDLSRRSDKNIPREATDDLRRKALTLQMMGEVDTPEAAQAMEAYRLEIIEQLTDIKAFGDTKYPQVEKIIEHCTKALTKGDLTEFVPTGFAAAKAAYDKFKGEWKSKPPTEALNKATEHKTAIDDLVVAAGTLKTNYEKAKAELKSILADLNGDKNKSEDSDPLGKLMKSTLKGSSEDLFGPIDKLTQEQVALRKAFEEAQQFYANSKVHDGDTMSGAWRTEAQGAMTKLRSKEAENVAEAQKTATELRQKMRDFAKEMAKLDTAKDGDRTRLVEDLVGKIVASMKADKEQDAEKIAYLKIKEKVKADISTAKETAKSKGKNPVAKTMLDQLRGIDKQRRTLTGEAEADRTWKDATAQLERIERDVADIAKRLGDTLKGKGEKIKNMRLGTKPDVLEKLAGDLKTAAADLVPKVIRPLIPNPDPEGLGTAADTLQTNLKALDLPGLAKLKSLAKEIDKANDEAEAGTPTKALRIEKREAALAEIRLFRNALENHPSVKLYRSNPFDKGTAVRLVETALHQVEIAVLACVSPREEA